jgi:NAD(P)-dependent dehydrogenase (short-subunit alcohol dehydrogenase family)
VSRLFQDVDNMTGAPDVVIFNASSRSRGPFISLDAAEVEAAIRTSAFGGFLVAQQAAKRTVPQARELSPLGIHVAHFIIDGAIRNPGRTEPPENPDSMLDPDAIAANYLHVLRQPRSASTWEMELRPWVEKF